MATFPDSVKSFTTLVDLVDSVLAAHQNERGEEITAIETVLIRMMEGWVPVRETWTYASESTITVPSDATAKYQTGMYVRYKQGAGYKYGIIIGLTSTLLTVYGAALYSVSNAAITDVSISMTRTRPVGFPDFFRLTINDDTAGDFGNVASNYCSIHIYTFAAVSSVEIDGYYKVRTSASPVLTLSWGKSTNIDLVTTDVTGTTGVDTHVTISVTNGHLKIENRSGSQIFVEIELNNPSFF